MDRGSPVHNATGIRNERDTRAFWKYRALAIVMSREMRMKTLNEGACRMTILGPGAIAAKNM